MASMSDIVRRAYRRCDGLLALGDVPTAEEAQEGLENLNGMMHAWKTKGVDIEHETLAASGTFPLDPEFEDGVVSLLAVRLAGLNGKQLAPQTMESAENAWRGLLARYIEVPETSFDNAIVLMPSSRVSRIWAFADAV
jgi:hypothetical protein